MDDFYVAIGDTTTFSKTVSESDVYLYAGISGDFAPNHVNEAYMAKSGYGRRIAHGALLIGFMSTCSTLMAYRPGADTSMTAVSLGYDRIRFIAPVFFGDTVTVTYAIASIDREKLRATSDIKVTNQDGTLVAVATHQLKWVRNG